MPCNRELRLPSIPNFYVYHKVPSRLVLNAVKSISSRSGTLWKIIDDRMGIIVLVTTDSETFLTADV